MTSAAASTLAVRARDLSLRYSSDNPDTRSIAVGGVSLDIAPGDVLAIVGETGSGKSTLAKAVALEADRVAEDSPRITGGTLDVLGVPVRGLGPRKRGLLRLGVGYLRQEAGDHLSPRLTVGENVAEPIFARDRWFDQDEAGEAVATLIDAVRLPLATMNKYPHELSKGQRQRVAIARSLILGPSLLVADDPTAGIDVTVRSAILDTIVALQEQQAFSALIVTADLGEVRRVSSRVAVMHGGIVVGIGEVDEVLETSPHPYVRSLGRTLSYLERRPVEA
ncbi:peptide/nickel transport system ATP-binding protein [Microbacteriaceae bacterium SG_E_30_P1]|uniref:Peptide/nickel transport system ATP-binding protein n=1 Tax=Antiquaquibacter oligotrophicus TaxID=2880260 RepID=A0ABT6KMN6_9MICO|nr:dipeptide/oligopeptide/nickel ABC transporter ATP-binding protein [Antiquaquibacter oligotrophicus]MDH6181114.1 peptide/nickel transport system ATP-binding protein [Antiquaquibacter oligotrophicus]UDF13188.1 dipeptide/oligopeptide/nickel ABC transporter ATP-binding protein [Antiquaquibacter oligotrophicus]